jgi:hypothetical protein
LTFQRKYIIIASLIVAVLALGLFSTWLQWNYTVCKLSEDAMEQALIVAQSIDSKRLKNLKGNSTDLNSPDYVRIKEQLTQIRFAHRKCRFLYLMGRKKDGTVFFFLDSQPPDSEDYAPPGLIYDEVSKEYLHTFYSGKRRTVGPITDRWGTLITSLVPIYSQENKELIAVLGMDIDAKDWRREIISQVSLPISLTISIILLTILLLIINLNRQILQKQYNEKNRFATELQQALQHVKMLQGLLPICSSCKKIRDDKGYWNSIESYIVDHSDVQFSHGLCEECSDKLYGQEDWYIEDKRNQQSEP